MTYIELMRDVMRLELAAEYLLMAAILAEIKSRLLLPRPPSEEGLEEDPRAELVRRLQEYERFKRAAEDIEALPRMERDTVAVQVDTGERNVIKLPPPLDLKEMLLALKDVMHRAELFGHHAIKREALSVRQRMGELLGRLEGNIFHRFETPVRSCRRAAGRGGDLPGHARTGQGNAGGDRAGSAAGTDLCEGKGHAVWRREPGRRRRAD